MEISIMGVSIGSDRLFVGTTEVGREHFAQKVIRQNNLVLNLDAGVNNSFKLGNTIWYDLSGNNNNGVLVNNPTYYPSNGRYINFDGTDDYIYLQNINYGGGNTISELSVMIWMRTSFNNGSNNNDGAYDSNNWALLDFDRSDVFNIFVEGGGQLKFAGSSSNNGGIGSSNYDIGAGSSSDLLLNDGQWHHIALTFSVANQAIKFYIDGKLVRDISGNGSMTALGNGVTRYGIIGDGSEADTENGNRNILYYQGDIASIRMHDGYILNDKKIKRHYNSIKKRFNL